MYINKRHTGLFFGEISMIYIFPDGSKINHSVISEQPCRFNKSYNKKIQGIRGGL